jgi:DNA polymerase III subunit delta
MRPAEFFSLVGEGPLLPLYYLCGSERYLQETAVQALLGRWGEKPSRSLNYEVFSGASASPSLILEAVRTLPFFGKQKFVLVRDAEKIPSSNGPHFLPYFENPHSKTVLIFLGSSFFFDKKVLAAFKRTGTSIECKPPATNELAEWVKHLARERGKAMHPSAVSLLREVAGSNLLELANEVEKLALYVDSRKEIAEEDVATLSSGTPVTSIFALIDQVMNRNLTGAALVLSQLLHYGEPPLLIVTMLVRQFRQLRKARNLLDQGLPPEAIKKTLEIRMDFVWNKLTGQLKKCSPAAIEQSFQRLGEADLTLKSRSLPARLVLEQLITDLCAYPGPHARAAAMPSHRVDREAPEA